MTNCKNCGAPLHGNCEYCGTRYEPAVVYQQAIDPDSLLFIDGVTARANQAQMMNQTATGIAIQRQQAMMNDAERLWNLTRASNRTDHWGNWPSSFWAWF